MRTRLITLAALGGIAVASFPAHAAAPTPQIVDVAGDANALNSQGLPSPVPAVPDTATPADFGAGDIVSVQFATTFVTKRVHRKVVKTPNGFTVTMALGGAPTTPEIFYRVVGTIAGCAQVFFEYGTDVATGGSDARCPATPPASDVAYTATAAVKGNSIVWTVPQGAFPNGTTFSGLNAQTRFNPAVVTAPQIDYASSANTYTVGK